MNNQGFPQSTNENLSTYLNKECEVCSRKDDEDLYIIFNILYRVIIGGNFHKKSKDEGLSYELNMIQSVEADHSSSNSKDHDLTPEEKINQFREKITPDLLECIILSTEFRDLLNEVFKTKYEHNLATCRHEELEKYILRSFEVPIEDQKYKFQHNLTDHLRKIKSIQNSIIQIKEDIQAYHSEISTLSDRIILKLFKSNPTISEKISLEEYKKAEDIYEEDES